MKDPGLLVLPLLALVVIGFVWMIVALSLLLLGFPPFSPNSGFLYQELFVAYIATYFLSTYFMAAIVAASHSRLEDRRPTVADGVRAANDHLLQIGAWSLLASTVGVLARMGSLRSEGAGRFVVRLFGYSWPIASVFVLPAILMEQLGPLRAFRRSQALLHQGWGSDQRGVLGTGVTFALFFLIGCVPFLWGLVGNDGLFVFVAVLFWLVLTVLWSAVHGILVTTLYHYATTSEASFGFRWQALNHPWVR